MWNAKKSVQLSLICTKIIIVGIFAVMAIVPLALLDVWWILSRNIFGSYNIAYVLSQSAILIPALYLTCAFILLALFRLHSLLSAIKRGEVFTPGNVRRLRVISWACFAVTLILLLTEMIWVIVTDSAGLPYPNLPLVLLAVAIAAAFIGLILRVVKNVFEAAVLLKDEVDFTI